MLIKPLLLVLSVAGIQTVLAYPLNPRFPSSNADVTVGAAAAPIPGPPRPPAPAPAAVVDDSLSIEIPSSLPGFGTLKARRAVVPGTTAADFPLAPPPPAPVKLADNLDLSVPIPGPIPNFEVRAVGADAAVNVDLAGPAFGPVPHVPFAPPPPPPVEVSDSLAVDIPESIPGLGFFGARRSPADDAGVPVAPNPARFPFPPPPPPVSIDNSLDVSIPEPAPGALPFPFPLPGFVKRTPSEDAPVKPPGPVVVPDFNPDPFTPDAPGPAFPLPPSPPPLKADDSLDISVPVFLPGLKVRSPNDDAINAGAPAGNAVNLEGSPSAALPIAIPPPQPTPNTIELDVALAPLLSQL
ncbi:hypothetical protein SCHPADRAFT_940234 [Schizopora paradoxa]|uniref:Uncharacterized protein n=1 Tax=Schizopora paradoxa TaxID=27342 RepID=A0A0H2RNM0_9AGAM|nr:hypothetical protein SCHPADRAFT_940234 [Schizopora paradoxa]